MSGAAQARQREKVDPASTFRCIAEIEQCERDLPRGGCVDVHGALQGLQDWSAELRLINEEGGA